MSKETNTTVAQLSQLAELCNATLKKEITDLVILMTEMNLHSVAEMKKTVAEAIKLKKSSPTEFVKRAQQLRAAIETNSPCEETIDGLVADLSAMTAANIKTVAKKLDISILSKADGELFAEWLRTGQKPPTEAEKMADVIKTEIGTALELKEKIFVYSQVDSHKVIDQILDIAESIKKTYKFPGLKAFLAGLNLEPSGKTVTSAIKDLKTYLLGIQADWFKSAGPGGIIETPVIF